MANTPLPLDHKIRFFFLSDVRELTSQTLDENAGDCFTHKHSKKSHLLNSGLLKEKHLLKMEVMQHQSPNILVREVNIQAAAPGVVTTTVRFPAVVAEKGTVFLFNYLKLVVVKKQLKVSCGFGGILTFIL